jgi:peptidoglycan hydrolase-like protein with peptidoglycan-binding domain
MDIDSMRPAARASGSRAVPPYPGELIMAGSRGDSVRQLQECLNNISKNHPEIGTLAVDGIFGNGTRNAVIMFQSIFGLTQDGLVGPTTWLAINEECAAPGSGGQPSDVYPGAPLGEGSRGDAVLTLQRCLNNIGAQWVGAKIPALTEDGIFGTGTENAVIAFQRFFVLPVDGVVGSDVWDRIMYECRAAGGIPQTPEPPPQTPAIPQYPGYLISVGSTGSYVQRIQQCLNRARSAYPAAPQLNEDGEFGPATRSAVIAFQNVFSLKADGIIGQQTWDKLFEECQNSGSGIPPREAVISGASATSPEPPVSEAIIRMTCLLMMMNHFMA